MCHSSLSTNIYVHCTSKDKSIPFLIFFTYCPTCDSLILIVLYFESAWSVNLNFVEIVTIKYVVMSGMAWHDMAWYVCWLWLCNIRDPLMIILSERIYINIEALWPAAWVDDVWGGGWGGGRAWEGGRRQSWEQGSEKKMWRQHGSLDVFGPKITFQLTDLKESKTSSLKIWCFEKVKL